MRNVHTCCYFKLLILNSCKENDICFVCANLFCIMSINLNPFEAYSGQNEVIVLIITFTCELSTIHWSTLSGSCISSLFSSRNLDSLLSNSLLDFLMSARHRVASSTPAYRDRRFQCELCWFVLLLLPSSTASFLLLACVLWPCSTQFCHVALLWFLSSSQNVFAPRSAAGADVMCEPEKVHTHITWLVLSLQLLNR